MTKKILGIGQFSNTFGTVFVGSLFERLRGSFDLPVFEWIWDSFIASVVYWYSRNSFLGQFSNGFGAVLIDQFSRGFGTVLMPQFSTDTFGTVFWVSFILRMMKFFKISKFSINGKVFTCFIDLLLMIICLVYVYIQFIYYRRFIIYRTYLGLFCSNIRTRVSVRLSQN